MDPCCKLFLEKIEVPRSWVDIEDQGRAIEHIGLGWSEQSKQNHRIAEWGDKIKAIILDRIGNGEGAGEDPEEVDE